MPEIVNGIFHVMRAGCPRPMLPSDFPPWETVYCWFAAWRDDGRFETINHLLAMADREHAGREASPAGAIIDSRSAKSTEAGGPRDYDDGKKINGRKRNAPVDHLGNCMRTLALPSATEPWSLASLREKLIKIGAKVVHHGR